MRHRQSKEKPLVQRKKKDLEISTFKYTAPKYGPLNSPNLPQGPVQDAVLYHRIIVKRHGKNKVNSAQCCVCAECNGFATARLKTPQFRQGFKTTCPSDIIKS